jgi:iron(III) transport system substrate-binding protein
LILGYVKKSSRNCPTIGKLNILFKGTGMTFLSKLLASLRVKSLFKKSVAAAVFTPVLAFAQSTVVVYTSAPAEIQNAMIPAIKAKLGLDVQVVSAGGGELMKRIQAESARPLADVVVSTGVDVIEANANLFEAYKVKDVAKLYPQYTKNPLWTPFAETIATVLAVNTKLVPEAEIPSSWAELANPKWKGKIAFAGADKSSSALTQMLQIVHNEGEPKGWNLFSDMMKNFVITGNSTAVIRGTAQGEYAMSLTLEDNAQRFIDGGAPIRIVYPKEGINSSADAMALVAKGPNPAGGKAVLDYLASAEGQTMLVKASGRRPVRADVAAPGSSPTAARLPVNNYSREWSAANSKDYMARYQQLLRR